MKGSLSGPSSGLASPLIGDSDSEYMSSSMH